MTKCVKITFQLCTVKRRVSCCKNSKPKKEKGTLPNLKTKSSGEAEGSGKGSFRKPVMFGRLDTCLSMWAGRARMEHEKNGVGWGRWGGRRRRKRRRWWWTNGRGLEVDGGQLAAGGLRELCQDAGQGPVLSLQPLLHLPQGLNLLYLGEVLQGGGQPQHRKTEKKRGGGGGGQEKRGTEWQKKEISINKWGVRERFNERQDSINE